MTNLKEQAVDGVVWTSIHTIVTVITGPILLMVQAQYLTPSEFGVLSVTNIFISIINVIENFGFSTAVIQRDSVTKDEKSSLFFFQIIFASLIAIMMILLSSSIAVFFEMPILTTLISLLSIIIMLNGPTILFTSFLEKEFFFKELSIIRIIRQFFLIITSIILLVAGQGLRGIIYGQIISVFVMVVLVLFVSLRNNLIDIKLHFSIKDIKPYLKFGLSIGSKQIITQLTHHIDELIIGYFFTAQALGYYSFAKNLLNRIRTLVSTAFSKVLLPLLSKLKNNIVLLSKTYNNVSKYMGVFIFPLFIGVALTAEQFIPILFGEEWIPSIELFIILSISYIPYLLTAGLATSLLYSVNKPHWVLSTELVTNIFYVLSLLILSWLEGSILTIAIIYASYLVVKTSTLQFLAQKNLHSNFKDYLFQFKCTVLSTIIMVLAVQLSKILFSTINSSIIELSLAIISGVVSYFISYIIIDQKTLKDMLKLVVKK